MASLPPLPTRQRRRYATKSQTSADIDSFRLATETAKAWESDYTYSLQRMGGLPPRVGIQVRESPPRVSNFQGGGTPPRRESVVSVISTTSTGGTIPRASILNDISVNSINYPRIRRDSVTSTGSRSRPARSKSEAERSSEGRFILTNGSTPKSKEEVENLAESRPSLTRRSRRNSDSRSESQTLKYKSDGKSEVETFGSTTETFKPISRAGLETLTRRISNLASGLNANTVPGSRASEPRSEPIPAKPNLEIQTTPSKPAEGTKVISLIKPKLETETQKSKGDKESLPKLENQTKAEPVPKGAVKKLKSDDSPKATTDFQIQGLSLGNQTKANSKPVPKVEVKKLKSDGSPKATTDSQNQGLSPLQKPQDKNSTVEVKQSVESLNEKKVNPIQKQTSPSTGSNVYASIRSSLKAAPKPSPKDDTKPKSEVVAATKPEVPKSVGIIVPSKTVPNEKPIPKDIKTPQSSLTSNQVKSKTESAAQTSPVTQRASVAKQVPDLVSSNGPINSVVRAKPDVASGDFRNLVSQNATRSMKIYKNRSITNPVLNGVTTGKFRLETSLSRSVDPTLIECCKQSDLVRLIKFIADVTPAVVGEAYINVSDEFGKTALCYAVSNNDIGIVKELCKVPSINPNLQDPDGNTCLHIAAQGGCSEILNLLTMINGVELDKMNYAGLTPLMKAALQGKSRCARILLVAGASPTIRDRKKNFCAYDWAIYCGRKACADMILKYMENSCKGAAEKLKWCSEPDLKASRLGRSLSFVGKVWKNVTGGKTDLSQQSLKRQLSVSAELTRIGITASMTSLPDLVPRELDSLRPKLTIPRIEISFWSPGMASIIPPPPARSPPKLNEEETAAAIEKPQQRKTQSNPQLYAVRSKGVLEVKFPVNIHKG